VNLALIILLLASCKKAEIQPQAQVAKSCLLSAAERAVPGIDTTKVFRSPDSTILHILTDTGDVIFKDSPDDGEGLTSWISEYSKDLDAYVVGQMYPEDRGVSLVFMKTGDVVGMPGAPLVSPSKRWAVSSSIDVSEARFEFNGMMLFDFGTKPIGMVHAWEGTEWGPDSVTWESDTVVRFAKMNQASECLGVGRLSLVDGNWHIDQVDTLVAPVETDSSGNGGSTSEASNP